MTNRFYAGQTNYIEEMNALDGETGDHIADTTGAHAATAISNTPAGNIAATTVQAAINELDTEKLSASATTLPASFTASSLTSVGTLTALTVSGQASFAAGSAAAPSVKVGAEQNGLYRSAANTLSVALGGLESFRFGYVASAVNYGQFAGNSAGGYPSLRAAGSDTNIGFDFATQGAAPFRFYTNAFGAEQFRILSTASAVNYAQITGSATGSPPVFSVAGTDANISFGLYSKGSGGVFAAVRGAVSAYFDNPASAVNYWLISGSTAGGFSNILEAAGTDSNIQNLYASKGTYGHMFRTNGSGGQTQFLVAHAPSAVNYYQVQGAATANAPVFFATGSDTNVSAIYSLKGTGNHVFYTATTTAAQLVISHTASAVNYAQITGSATGNAVTASAAGSDSNIDFAITPKGTGNVRFGTHSAIASETVTGYITIKDSAGNTRKLAVVS